MATHVTRRMPPFLKLMNEGTRKVAFQTKPEAAEKSRSFFVWMALIGIFIPPVPISFGEITFTPARMIIVLLLAPAFVVLSKKNRRWVASDFFAIMTAAWMVTSSLLNGGFRLYVGAEALDFLGAYFLGRAFFWGDANLRAFSRAFKVVALIVIGLALLDVVTGRLLTLEIVGILPSMQDMQSAQNPPFDSRSFRATSVFPNTISYGAFCAAATPIFFYSENSKVSRIFFVCIGIFGCVLAMSSAPLLGLAIALGALGYDAFLKQYAYRWRILVGTALAIFTLAFLISNSLPVWIVTHLTFDPQTGFFRIATWDIALYQIGLSPLLGHGVVQFAGEGWGWVFLKSVDCLWLVEALRYGLPCILLLLLTILIPFLTPPPRELCTGVSLAIVTMMLIGLTVHYWDTAWLFLFLCVGIRASFAETGRLLPARRRKVLVGRKH